MNGFSGPKSFRESRETSPRTQVAREASCLVRISCDAFTSSALLFFAETRDHSQTTFKEIIKAFR